MSIESDFLASFGVIGILLRNRVCVDGSLDFRPFSPVEARTKLINTFVVLADDNCFAERTVRLAIEVLVDQLGKGTSLVGGIVAQINRLSEFENCDHL